MTTKARAAIKGLRGLARVVFAGALMGWANLVPGVSGGTMLLVCGVYPAFVSAVTDLMRLRFRTGALRWVAALGGGAVVAVLLSAGVVKDLVETQPVAMYSLFIGLTLGGVPPVVRRAAPLSASVWAAGIAALSGMILLAFFDRGGASDVGALSRFSAGVVGASAMVLPGLSGSYLLLLMGQYVSILGAIGTLRKATIDPLLFGGAVDPALAGEALAVLVPFAVGVAAGIVLVSQAVRIALERAPAPTYGLLLGLLLGAIPGLWPFDGTPGAAEVGIGLLCLLAGWVLTYGLSRLETRGSPSGPI